MIPAGEAMTGVAGHPQGVCGLRLWRAAFLMSLFLKLLLDGGAHGEVRYSLSEYVTG